jgi:predicted RecA/RadA family phage recombinase
MKNYQSSGATLPLTAPYDVASGGGMKVGAIFGVASVDAVAGDIVEAARVGKFSLAKVAATAISEGAKVYWDDTNKVVTPTASGNTLIGAAAMAADAAATVASVILDGAVR